MPLPIFVTAFSSHLPKMGSRLRQFAVFKACEPLAWARRAKSSSSKHRSQSGEKPLVTKVGDYRLFFGWRSDPFFFDVNGNFNHMQFTGDDFFKDKNVCSIVHRTCPTRLWETRRGNLGSHSG